jgi:hypothetical protein
LVHYYAVELDYLRLYNLIAKHIPPGSVECLLVISHQFLAGTFTI